ncbi:MAG: hypothetical protein AB1508_11495 [Pseudomonadota bacterium]
MVRLFINVAVFWLLAIPFDMLARHDSFGNALKIATGVAVLALIVPFVGTR